MWIILYNGLQLSLHFYVYNLYIYGEREKSKIKSQNEYS